MTKRTDRKKMDKMKRTDMTKKTDRTKKKDSTAASNPQFWAWVHIFLKFTARMFFFTMNSCLPLH